MACCCIGIFSAVLALLLAIAFLFKSSFKKWIAGSTFDRDVRMDGKVVIITGCNTGIGKETARDLARRGAHVLMACRTKKKMEEAAEEIIKENPKAKITFYELDLSSFKSIRQCAKKILENTPKIDVLINNAGIGLCPHALTEDGYEMQFGTNHLGHFLFTNLLLDRLKASAPARIVNVSSYAHVWGSMQWDDLNMKKKYSTGGAYNQSKLANVLFTKELAKRLKDTGVTTYSLHPGAVTTDIDRHFGQFNWLFVQIFRATKIFFKDSMQGAQTTIYCAVAKELANETGKYYSDCKEVSSSRASMKEEDAKRLWDESVKMTKLES